MTFDQFIKNHLGKGVDVDGAAGVQCVDLATAYFNEVFGSGIKNFWFDAHHFWDLFEQNAWLKANFTKLANTPAFVPQKGDVAIWSGSLNGGWGHIAICDGVGDTTYFYSYDQNWSGRHDPCARVKHSYSHIAGFLRPKEQSKLTGALPVLDETGMKQGDKNLGVYYLKTLLSIAEQKKLIPTHITVDKGFGSGTTAVVNALLARWGYRQNGIAGTGFADRVREMVR